MTRKQLLIYLLQQAGERGLTTGELMAGGVGSRYSARLMEAREDGYVISSERIREGSWRYRLLREPEPGASQPTESRGAPDSGSALSGAARAEVGGHLFGNQSAKVPVCKEDSAAPACRPESAAPEPAAVLEPSAAADSGVLFNMPKVSRTRSAITGRAA